MNIKDVFKNLFAGENAKICAEENFDGKVTSRGVEQAFSDCGDFVSREVAFGAGLRARLYFLDGIVTGRDVSELVIRPMTNDVRFGNVCDEKSAAELMLSGSVYGHTVKERKTVRETVMDILYGYCAVIFDKIDLAVTFDVRSLEKRAINEPKEEKSVKGAKDAFIEIMRTNTALIRRRIQNHNLKIRSVSVGRETNTFVSIIYIKDFTNMNIVNEMEKRIRNIDVSGVLTAAVLEECIADEPNTPFPQLIQTERPDKFCLNLLEGRVGVIVDGLPMGYLAPGTFTQFMKVPEDSASHFITGSCITLLRYVSFAVTLLLPAFYVAIAAFHQEMIPTKLMQSIIDAKRSVPFPTAVEVLGMLVAFELLQEAGLRLPNPVGQTVSIIGALIVGQSAVEARVVSPIVVIVVAFAGIAGYTMPNQDMMSALRICRFLLVILAILAGVFGLAIGITVLTYHLCTLESFGVSYMTPFAGADGKHMIRGILRSPMTKGDPREPALKPEDDSKVPLGQRADRK